MSRMWWYMPVGLTTWEAEEGRLPEPRSLRLQGAMIATALQPGQQQILEMCVYVCVCGSAESILSLVFVCREVHSWLPHLGSATLTAAVAPRWVKQLQAPVVGAATTMKPEWSADAQGAAFVELGRVILIPQLELLAPSQESLPPSLLWLFLDYNT